MNEDSQMLHQIISRYETEEDEFLRELESMQQCANTDTSDDMPDESPVLGTLCSLVGEIGQLRKENRKLRRRILENSTSSTETTPPVAARLGVVHRVGAFLDSGRTSIIPKLLPSYRKMLSSNEIRTGARERLSSPPRKDCLTTSSYSTDYSIDNLSLRSQKMKIPPLVLPEMSDSENENSIFAEVMLPEIDVTEQNNIDKLDSLLRPRRSMMRRLHVNSHQKGSDHASPSSISASSSIEPPDTMSSSRASFLEFIGIKRKSERNRMSMPIPSNFNVGAFINKKQRKRKMTENENVDARNNYEKTLAIKQKGDSKTGKDEEKPAVRKSTLKPSFAKSCRSLFEKQPTNCKTHFYDESEEESLYKNKKQRPKSVVYLEPDRSTIVASHIQKKAASYKNMMDSRDTSEENYRHTNQNEYIGLRNENVSLKNELDNLKNFNSKLTEDLTQKNKVVENLENKYASLERQSDSWKRKCIMNEAFDNAYQNERLESQKIKMINKIDGKLSEFEKTLKNVKEECVKNQQLMLNHSIRDQNAYQSCLEQVERLQRENFALIQMNATDKDFDEDDENMRRKLKMMPSYDALYSFTMSIVRKLSNIRKHLVEKCNALNSSELEILHLQTSLLITHAQIERQKLQITQDKKQQNMRKRSHSFHGINNKDLCVQKCLSFYLPFKLHGNRMEQYKKGLETNIDNQAESNEQSIETEFLRLFDFARSLSEICNDKIIFQENKNDHKEKTKAQSVIIYRNGKDIKVSPHNSPKIDDRHNMLGGNLKNVKNTKISPKDVQTIDANINMFNQNMLTAASKRPKSLFDVKDKKGNGSYKKSSSNEEELGQPTYTKPPSQPCNVIDHHSPKSTPALNRKCNVITFNDMVPNSRHSQERKLVKQRSLQQQYTHQTDFNICGKSATSKSHINDSSEYAALKCRFENLSNASKDYGNIYGTNKYTSPVQLPKALTSSPNQSTRYYQVNNNISTPSLIPTSPSIRRSHIISIKKPTKSSDHQQPLNQTFASIINNVNTPSNKKPTSAIIGSSVRSSTSKNNLNSQLLPSHQQSNLFSTSDEVNAYNSSLNNVRSSIAKMNAMAKLQQMESTAPANFTTFGSPDKNTDTSFLNPVQLQKVVKRAGTSWLSKLRPISKK